MNSNQLHPVWQPVWDRPFLFFSGIILILVYFGFQPLVWQPLRQRALRTMTPNAELDLLDEPRIHPRIRGTCLVAGASISGLLTAAVASKHFEQVVIVEPDGQLYQRRGHVTQWAQAHVFGNIVVKAVSKIFSSNFAQEIEKQESVLSSVNSLDILLSGERLQHVDDLNLDIFGVTRMGLERLLRSLLDSSEYQVKFIQGSVVGLLPSPDTTHIDAVMIQESDQNQYSLPVSLFADCSGPAACGRKLLQQPNPKNSDDPAPMWTLVPVSKYNPDLYYSTAIVNVPLEHVSSLPRPPHCKGKMWENIGLLNITNPLPIVDVRLAMFWHGQKRMYTFQAGGGPLFKGSIHTLSDYKDFVQKLEFDLRGTQPPEWVDQFLDAMLGLEQRDLIKVEFKPSRKTLSEYNHYLDVVDRLPSNFVAIGDSFSHLNPRFGTGTAKLVGDVITLNTLLHEIPENRPIMMKNARNEPVQDDACRQNQETLPSNITKKYFEKAHPRQWLWWEMARNQDYGSSSTKLIDPNDSYQTGWFDRQYMLALTQLGTKDKKVAQLVLRFFTSDPSLSPLDVFYPPLLVRVLWQMWRTRR